MYPPSFSMTIRKTLTSIVLAGALALGVAGCKDDNQKQPEQKIFPYTNAGQIAEFPSGRIDEAIGLAAADFDGDGDIDLAFVSGYQNRGKVFLYRNDGSDNFVNTSK